MERSGTLSKLLLRHPSLKRKLTRRTLAPGDILVGAGDAIEHVIFPISGMITDVVALDGDFVGSGMIGRDGAVGSGVIFGASTHLNPSLCVFPGTAFVLPSAAFVEITKGDESICRTHFALHSWMLVQAQYIAACNVRHTVSQRLSRWLLQAAMVNGSETIPVTQDVIAQLLGVTRATISKNAGELDQRGCLRYKRGVISLVNREILEAQACECHSKLKYWRSKLEQDHD
jgi:CRP-like cAMP-binding protein